MSSEFSDQFFIHAPFIHTRWTSCTQTMVGSLTTQISHVCQFAGDLLQSIDPNGLATVPDMLWVTFQGTKIQVMTTLRIMGGVQTYVFLIEANNAMCRLIHILICCDHFGIFLKILSTTLMIFGTLLNVFYKFQVLFLIILHFDLGIITSLQSLMFIHSP